LPGGKSTGGKVVLGSIDDAYGSWRFLEKHFYQDLAMPNECRTMTVYLTEPSAAGMIIGTI